MKRQMKNKLYYSPKALNDLDDIWEYIRTELKNPNAADNVVSKIMDTVDRLQDFAEIGAPLCTISDVETNYRFLISGVYMVFYRPDKNIVFIDRILYGRRDYLQILFPNLQEETE